MARFIIVLVSFFIAHQGLAYHKSARCDNCTATQYRNLAASTAGSSANVGVTIYIGDFDNHQFNKYFVVVDQPLSPTGDPIEALKEVGLDSGVTPCGSGLVWRIAALCPLDIASYAIVDKDTALHQTRLARDHVRLNQRFP